MSKIALNAVRVTCAIIVVCFFFTYFVISCTGYEVNISGMEAAFGIDQSSDMPLDPSPMLLLIPLIALAVLAALHVPVVREKLESVKLPVTNIPVIGDFDTFSCLAVIAGILGLILLAIAYSSSVGRLKSQMGMYSGYIDYHTGFGFKTSVFTYIVLLAIPFVDKFVLRKKAPPQDEAAPQDNTPTS